MTLSALASDAQASSAKVDRCYDANTPHDIRLSDDTAPAP